MSNRTEGDEAARDLEQAQRFVDEVAPQSAHREWKLFASGAILAFLTDARKRERDRILELIKGHVRDEEALLASLIGKRTP